MLLDLDPDGVMLRSRYSLQMLYRGIASSFLHSLRRIAGKPSGPAAAFVDISSMDLTMFGFDGFDYGTRKIFTQISNILIISPK